VPEALTRVDLSSCCAASSLMVLLAWACTFSQALLNGTYFKAKEVEIVLGNPPPHPHPPPHA